MPVTPQHGGVESQTTKARLNQFSASLRSKAIDRLLKSDAAAQLVESVQSELAMRKEQRGRVMLVSSSRRREGRTTVSVVLAGLAATVDPASQILLIDADNGDAARLIVGESRDVGLDAVLAGDASLDACIIGSALTNLHVLSPGKTLISSLMRHTASISKLTQGPGWDRYDTIIFDAGPVIENHVLLLTRAAQETILVIRSGRSTQPDVQRALSELRRVGAVVYGIVNGGRSQRSIRSIIGGP